MKLPIPIKTDSCIPWGHAHLLRWPILCLWRAFPWINLLLTYYFVSLWILSVIRHQESELHEVLRPCVWSQLTDHCSKSQCGFWLGSSPHNYVSQFLLKINLFLYIHPSFQHTHTHTHTHTHRIGSVFPRCSKTGSTAANMYTKSDSYGSGSEAMQFRLGLGGVRDPREQASDSVHALHKTLQGLWFPSK